MNDNHTCKTNFSFDIYIFISDIASMNVIQDVATLYSVLQNVTGASGQVSYQFRLSSIDG